MDKITRRQHDNFELLLRTQLACVRAAADSIAALKIDSVLSAETIKRIEDEFSVGIQEIIVLLDDARERGALSPETVSELKGRFLRQN